MWIQLRVSKQLDIDGKARAYHAGDWVNVGKQRALQWLQSGEAQVAQPVKVDLPPGSGIVVWRGDPAMAKAEGVNIVTGDRRLAFERTLLLDTSLPLRLDLVGVGFGFLSQWQVAAPIASYEQLAGDIGTAEERERTKALIHDLRVPYYDSRLLFLRRCPECEELLAAWQEEMTGGDERLALLRAIYRVKPLILALPMTWTERRTV